MTTKKIKDALLLADLTKVMQTMYKTTDTNLLRLLRAVRELREFETFFKIAKQKRFKYITSQYITLCKMFDFYKIRHLHTFTTVDEFTFKTNDTDDAIVEHRAILWQNRNAN